MRNNIESLCNAATGDTVADERDATDHQRSGSSSGRHPPCCGGVPPVPRTRRHAANVPANKIAEIAPRSSFISRACSPHDANATSLVVHSATLTENRNETHRLLGGLVTGVGLPGIEPGTSSLSAMRSNRLSYSPSRYETLSAVSRINTRGSRPVQSSIKTVVSVRYGRSRRRSLRE